MNGQLAQIDGGTAAAVALGVALAAAVAVLVRLVQAMRAMSRQHESTVRALISRHNHVEATLSSMLDGVLAVDIDGRIISVNDAAGRLLGIKPGRAGGQPFEQVIGHASLSPLIGETVAGTTPTHAEIVIKDRRYQVHGTVLRDSEGARLGSLVVLHDVTLLRRLEQVRRDFVANASHEIKTPVTAIKAAAETLIDANGRDTEAARHFVGVIGRQADRLSALVEDLLSIARLEADLEHARVTAQVQPIRPVLEAAMETCRASIESRSATVDLTCQSDLSAPVKADLLEQAVVNLIDNAVKYSDEGSSVQVTAERVGSDVVIAVYDKGIGIAPEHLSRIFERFYRTDRARSRQLGGTGLGLAIVKHIAGAHGGRVSVDSTPGLGSTFRMHIPAS